MAWRQKVTASQDIEARLADVRYEGLEQVNTAFIKQQAQMGDRHVYAARTRFVSPAMLKHFEECVWLTADQAHSRKPMPDSVRMLVRERARNAWK